MQKETPDIRKRKRKPRKMRSNNNQDPTQLLFWQDIEPSIQTPNVPNLKNLMSHPKLTKKQKKKLVNVYALQGKKKGSEGQSIANPASANQPIFPNTSGQLDISNEPIFPEISSQPIRPGMSCQPVLPGISGQPVRPGISLQTGCAGSPGQSVRPGIPGQSIRPGISGQPVRPRITGQSVRPCISGQPVRPGTSGQPVRLGISGQPVRPGISGQTIRPGISGQAVRPVVSSQTPSIPGQLIYSGVSVQPVRPGVPGKPLRTFTSVQPANIKQHISQTKLPNATPGQGPKFKPLQEVNKPQLIPNVTNNKQPQSSLVQNTVNPIITVVGKNKVNKVGTQKKILQFQMRMKSMQQAKTPQERTLEHVTNQDAPATANTFVNRNVGLSNPNQIGFGSQIPTGMQIPMAVPNPFGVQNPTTLQNPMQVPSPVGVSLLIGVPRPALLSYPVGVPNPIAMQNISNVKSHASGNNRHQTSAHNVSGNKNKNSSPINVHQNQNNQVSIPLTPLPALTPEKPSDVVETVFQMDCEKSYSPPPLTHTPVTPSKQQLSPKSVNVQSTRPNQHASGSMAGMNYPKGIPRSFLRNSAKNKGEDRHSWPGYQVNAPMPNLPSINEPITVDTEDHEDIPQPYSPSELYADINPTHDQEYDDSEQQESKQSGMKRLSAFQRLGPPQPKKPKLTISVTVNDDQEVREVVDESEDQKKITPVHLREDLMLSTDETVKKYLQAWPWKNNVVVKKCVTSRNSKTAMMLEREQMENIYNKYDLFIQVTVKGYPPSWKKEDVLDALMENIRVTFIPCFIEFNREECKFLTLRCRSALLSFHQCGFIIRKQDVELMITISQTELTLSNLDFVPRLVLRKRLMMGGDKETVLDLSAFTLQEDISHFIYYPLHRPDNQMEIKEMQTEISWSKLTELNLSHNKIKSLDGFDLERSAPQLKHLNLSHNCLEKITLLLKCRGLPLNTIHLEGNPLCSNYIDPGEYVRVVRMMFSGVKTIDGVPVTLKGEMPNFHRVYCPDEAKEVTDKFLQVYFRLLDENLDNRELLHNMYESSANMTITHNYKLAFSPIYKGYKSLFSNARRLDDGKLYIIKGSAAIIKTITSWPQIEHDPHTFTVDVIHHSDTKTIIRVDGILKLTSEALEDDEHLLSFSRTVVLHTKDFVEYKIQSEMLYWSIPAGDYARSAFSTILIKPKQYPKIDSTADEDLQGELLKIFMQLTTMNKKISERCLEFKKWNLRDALEHFTQLWKSDNVEAS